MRVVLYARYSTDHLGLPSVKTQLAACRLEIAMRGWSEVDFFTDKAESCAPMHRPGIQALLASVARGGIDAVFSDAMDRISRGQADIAAFYEWLKFRGVAVATRNEGIIAPLHIGMFGTLNAARIIPASDNWQCTTLASEGGG